MTTPIEDLIPIRSLWTDIRTGQRVIVTDVQLDDPLYVWYLFVGKSGWGGTLLSHFVDRYVMTSEGCTIQVRSR